MKLKNQTLLILLTLAALGFVNYSNKVLEKTETRSNQKEVVEETEIKSSQKKLSSELQEYKITLNGKPITIDSNTLLYRPLHFLGQSRSPDYLPLFPILDAMEVSYEGGNSGKIVYEGKNKVEIYYGAKYQTRNGYKIKSPEFKVVNGQVWISTSKTLPILLGIDRLKWNEQKQEWQLYRFPKQREKQTSLEKKAIDLVKNYLTTSEEARSKLLTPNTEIEEPFFLEEYKNLPVRDISIESVTQLTPADNLNRGTVKIVVRYTTEYDGKSSQDRPEEKYNVPGETRHEKIFIAIADGGKVLIDDVFGHRMNRTWTGAPIPFLEEEDYIEIATEWNKKSPGLCYNTSYVSCDKFLHQVMNKMATSNKSRLASLDDQTLSSLVSEEIRQSQGWKDFLALENGFIPLFTVLGANYASDRRTLSVTLVGDWETDSGVGVTPILMEVKLVRNYNYSWELIGIANVRLYKNARELELNEPETYQKLARLYSYLRDLDPDFEPFL